MQPLVDVAEEASGACLGLQCTRTHTVLIPSELRITVQSQLVSGCDEKHRRHRNRKFERWLEPNPAPTTITPFVSVYTLHMPPAETLVISLETAAATKNEMRNSEKQSQHLQSRTHQPIQQPHQYQYPFKQQQPYQTTVSASFLKTSSTWYHFSCMQPAQEKNFEPRTRYAFAK